MFETLHRSKRNLLASLGLAAAMTLAIVVGLPRFALSPTPSPEIFRKVSASQLGPGIKLQLPGPGDVPAVSQEQALRVVAPALGNDLDEVHLVRFHDAASVPTVDILAWVFSFRTPPRFSSGPVSLPGPASKPTPPPPSGGYWMVVIDARTGEFVTAFGKTW